MKKPLFYLFISCITTTAFADSPSQPFNDFYIGVIGGHIKTTAYSKFQADLGVKINEETEHLKAGEVRRSAYSEFSYGTMIGYGKVLNSLYLGAEVSLQNHIGNNKAQQYSFKVRNESEMDCNVKAKMKYKRGIIFGLTPRVGYLFDGKYLVYFKLGVERSKDYLSGHFVNGQLQHFKSTNKQNIVFVPGIGFEKSFGDTTRVRVEYGYNLGSKVSKIGNSIFENVKYKFNEQAKYNAHEVKIGVSFKI